MEVDYRCSPRYGSGNQLEDSEHNGNSVQEVDEDILHHHLPNLTTSTQGDNRTLEIDLEGSRPGVDFFAPQIDLTATQNLIVSENASLFNLAENITYQKLTTSQYLTQFGRQSDKGDVFKRDTTEPLSPASSGPVQHYEQSIVRDILTRDPLPEQADTFSMTSTTSEELVRKPSRHHELTTEPLNYLTTKLNMTVTESKDILLSESDVVPSSNMSSEQMLLYEDLYNTSQIWFWRPSAMNESLSNPISSSPWLDNINDTLDHQKLLNVSDPSSFNFDLTSWLALTPSSTTDNGPIVSGSGSNETAVVVKVVFLAMISILGSIGNVMLLWSVVKERHLHRPPFYFLLSLGVTDLSRAVFCVPVVMTTVLHGSRWRHGESACKLFAFATSFFVFSSALSLLAIAIDRHICIIYSKTYRRRAPGIANLVAAIIIWVIAFSASFPPVVGLGEYAFIPEEAQCTYQHTPYSLNGSVSSVFVFLAILFMTFSLYFRIFQFLRTHRRMRPLQHTPALSSNWAFVGPGANGQAFINWLNGFGGQVPVREQGQRAVQRLNFGRVVNLSIAKNEHLTRLFLVLTTAFGVSWLPYVILSLWRIFYDASLVPPSYATVSAWLGYGQLAVCPVVYFVARGPVRKPTRTVYSQATEKKNFLLENKIGK